MDDNSFSAEQWETKGALAPHAANSVINVLYVARVYRWGLLWMASGLAMHVTTWNPVSDIELRRCIAYMKPTEALVMQSCVTEHIHISNVAAFSDAEFAGGFSHE